MATTRWEASDVAFLRAAVRDKVSVAVISDMLGRDELSVAFKIQALKLERAPPI